MVEIFACNSVEISGNSKTLKPCITQEEGPRRRALGNQCRANYQIAADTFAALEDAAMFLTVQLEHIHVLETQANFSTNLKLKSLQSVIQLLRQSHSIMKLIKNRDADEQKEPKPDDIDDKSIKSEHSLLTLFESRLHFALKSIIQYCRSKSNKDYEKMGDLYKRMYCVSLKVKSNDDVRLYAKSICEVLEDLEGICKEFE